MKTRIIDCGFTFNADGGFFEVSYNAITGDWKVRDLQIDRTIATYPETRYRQFINPGRAKQMLERALKKIS